MWGSVSRLSENQREFETLTEAKAKFDEGEKERVRLKKSERETNEGMMEGKGKER